jgi:hypothetical protein
MGGILEHGARKQAVVMVRGVSAGGFKACKGITDRKGQRSKTYICHGDVQQFAADIVIAKGIRGQRREVMQRERYAGLVPEPAACGKE